MGYRNPNAPARCQCVVDSKPTRRHVMPVMESDARHASTTRLLDAALHVIRATGSAATTVDDICRTAGVTKGSFCHHVATKDALALAAAAHFSARSDGVFTTAPCRSMPDPLDRLLGDVAFRGESLHGGLPDYTCLPGTLVQETYATHPDILAACDSGMSGHIAALTSDVEAAQRLCAPTATWSEESVGYVIQAILQGAFMVAKAKQDPAVVHESLAHLARYLESLLPRPPTTR